tara:strand:+ start:1051 stop:1302 length:252 start_codon:yes stop_codon:yes gene_type:complete
VPQIKPDIVTPKELDQLARRYQRFVSALTRLARTSHDHTLRLKLSTLSNAHLARLEESLDIMATSAYRQTRDEDPKTARSLLV